MVGCKKQLFTNILDRKNNELYEEDVYSSQA